MSVDPHPPTEPILGPTPPRWAAAQVPHWRELLVEQAHLEKKAASAALGLLFRLPAGTGHERALSALAREELVHFERALKFAAARGVAFGPQQPSAYAEQLKRAARRTMPERLVDEVLLGAIIEGRSCERMHLLAAAFAATDAELSAFYADLVLAEARHEELYVEIAAGLVGAAQASHRLAELRAHEAAVLDALPFSPRLHGGLPAAAPEGGDG